jgi:hypothetical protein
VCRGNDEDWVDTMSEKLPKPAGGGHEISARETWRMIGIMAEFVEATGRLAGMHNL